MKRGWNKYRIHSCITTIFMGLMMADTENNTQQEIEQVTFGAGCFWCVEAIFDRLEGVVDVRAGFTGGNIENPTYDNVCSGETGHVEVVQVDFNPKIISFNQLLDIFWQSHDPTTLNRQGSDMGTQYRSSVFYANDKQRIIAEKSMKKADGSDLYEDPIVTEIIPLGIFYLAEKYHQDYYRINPNAPYCRLVIEPKLAKLFKIFK